MEPALRSHEEDSLEESPRESAGQAALEIYWSNLMPAAAPSSPPAGDFPEQAIERNSTAERKTTPDEELSLEESAGFLS